jgi:hypothetical protein
MSCWEDCYPIHYAKGKEGCLLKFAGFLKTNVFIFFNLFSSPSSVDCTYHIKKMIKLTKKAIELLDAVTSVPYSRKGLGYTITTIGCGLDAVFPFTCFSYWFSRSNVRFLCRNVTFLDILNLTLQFHIRLVELFHNSLIEVSKQSGQTLQKD